jgi:hypothetical protein
MYQQFEVQQSNLSNLFHAETGYLDLLSKRCLSAEAAEQAGNSAYFRRMNCMIGYIKLTCLK